MTGANAVKFLLN